jgi:predicted transcriptional regulator
MAWHLTLRLDEKTRKRIALIARRDKISGSEVVRRAIEAWRDFPNP